jgi:hypothetical protein
MPYASHLLLAAALAMSSAAVVRADDWSVTSADFHTDPVTLRGLSGNGVHVSAVDGSGDRTIPLDQFISAQRLASTGPAATPKYTLALSDGDRLVGEPSAMSGETLTWTEPLLGSVPVGLSRLVAMGKGSTAPVPDDRPKQDVVTLANGDTVAGVLSGVTGAKLTVQSTDGGSTDVPLSGVAHVAFANTGGGAAATGHGYQLRLVDGSTVSAVAIDVAGSGVSLTLPGKGAKPIALHLTDVAGIEQLNGPVGWLSSRSPTESVQVPYLGGAITWPARMDSAVDGSPLTFDGRPFGHGIGVHAYSRLTFAVDPGWTAFRTQYAIDSRRDAPRLLADVTVRIKVDGTVVHEAAHVRAGTLSPVVRVDLTGAKALTLECDYGPAGDTQAHLNWLQPALLRGATTRP